MRRFNAYSAVFAMLASLLSAPLFHVHDGDDHGGSFVHAHFLAAEEAPPASGYAIEDAHHSHEHARWIDVFTLSTPVTASFHEVAEFSEPLSVPPPQLSRFAEPVPSLHAHGPPDSSSAGPRPPPVF